MPEVIEIFRAVSPDGSVLELFVWQESIDASHAGGSRMLPGATWLETEDGDEVNRLSEDEFQVVNTGTILTRI